MAKLLIATIIIAFAVYGLGDAAQQAAFSLGVTP